jgi:hypothetical protein
MAMSEQNEQTVNAYLPTFHTAQIDIATDASRYKVVAAGRRVAGQNRSFLSLREAFDQAESDAISAKGLEVSLAGRGDETRRIGEFLRSWCRSCRISPYIKIRHRLT